MNKPTSQSNYGRNDKVRASFLKINKYLVLMMGNVLHTRMIST